jgi:hypothetical protein
MFDTIEPFECENCGSLQIEGCAFEKLDTPRVKIIAGLFRCRRCLYSQSRQFQYQTEGDLKALVRRVKDVLEKATQNELEDREAGFRRWVPVSTWLPEDRAYDLGEYRRKMGDLMPRYDRLL